MTATVARPPYRSRTRDDLSRRIVYWLLLVLVATLPGQGIIKLGGEATVSKGVGGVVTVAALLALVKTGRRVRLNDYMILVLVFAAWVLVSTYWTITLKQSEQRVITMVQLVVMVLLLWEFAHTRRRVYGLMAAWVVGCVVLAGFIVFEWAHGAGAKRYTAPGTHPGDQAYALLLAIPLAWYLSVRELRRRRVLLYRLFIPFALFAVVLTASRAALLSAALALVVVPLTLRAVSGGARVAIGGVVLAGLVAAGALIAADAGPIQRLSTTSSELTSGTLDQRTVLWSIGLRSMGAHPVLGVGTGGAHAVVGVSSGAERSLHNTFLSIGVDLGLVGLGLFLLVIYAASYRGLRWMPWLEQRVYWVLLAVFLVSLVPRSDDYDKGTWAMLTILALFGSVYTPGRAQPTST